MSQVSRIRKNIDAQAGKKEKQPAVFSFRIKELTLFASLFFCAGFLVSWIALNILSSAF